MPQTCVATEIYCRDTNGGGQQFEQTGGKGKLTLLDGEVEVVVYLQCSSDGVGICTAAESYENIEAYWIVRLDPDTRVLYIGHMSLTGSSRTGRLDHFSMVCKASSN